MSQPNEHENLYEQYVNLYCRVKDMEASLEEAKRRLREMGELILDSWALSGERCTHWGNCTIYRTVWWYVTPKPGATAENICAALKRHGFGDLVHETYDPKALRDLLCHIKEETGDIPSWASDILSLVPVHRVQVRVVA